MDEYPGYAIYTAIKALRGKDGRWRVIHTLQQSRSSDLETWEDKQIEIEAIDDNLNTAIAQTSVSIGTYLHTVNNDLFAESVKSTEVLPS